MVDLDKVIKSALKSGKVFYGTKQTVNSAKTGKAVTLIQASNCPEEIKNEIKSYADKSKIPVYTYPGSALDLGLMCGKPFIVSAMTIRTLSDAELLRAIKESVGEEDQAEDKQS